MKETVKTLTFGVFGFAAIASVLIALLFVCRYIGSYFWGSDGNIYLDITEGFFSVVVFGFCIAVIWKIGSFLRNCYDKSASLPKS